MNQPQYRWRFLADQVGRWDYKGLQNLFVATRRLNGVLQLLMAILWYLFIGPNRNRLIFQGQTEGRPVAMRA